MGLGERKERSGIGGESESARQCQVLRRGQVKSRVAKGISEYRHYIVIGDLIKGSFGGALRKMSDCSAVNKAWKMVRSKVGQFFH